MGMFGWLANLFGGPKPMPGPMPTPVPAPAPWPTKLPPSPFPVPPPAPAPLTFMDPQNWTIGPVDYYGRNTSVGMPLHPAPHPEGWSFDLGPAPQSAHYITAPSGSIAGKREIAIRYRVEMVDGTVIYPTNFWGSPSMLSLYFQRAGDNYSALGPYEDYRWYGPTLHSPIVAGDHELIEPLDADWANVMGHHRGDRAAGWADALANCAVIGFVLGGGDGRGHGISSTAPAKIIVKSFEVR